MNLRKHHIWSSGSEWFSAVLNHQHYSSLAVSNVGRLEAGIKTRWNNIELYTLITDVLLEEASIDRETLFLTVSSIWSFQRPFHFVMKSTIGIDFSGGINLDVSRMSAPRVNRRRRMNVWSKLNSSQFHSGGDVSLTLRQSAGLTARLPALPDNKIIATIILPHEWTIMWQFCYANSNSWFSSQINQGSKLWIRRLMWPFQPFAPWTCSHSV